MDGFASIGFTGMPREMWHWVANVDASCPDLRSSESETDIALYIYIYSICRERE